MANIISLVGMIVPGHFHQLPVVQLLYIQHNGSSNNEYWGNSSVCTARLWVQGASGPDVGCAKYARVGRANACTGRPGNMWRKPTRWGVVKIAGVKTPVMKAKKAVKTWRRPPGRGDELNSMDNHPSTTSGTLTSAILYWKGQQVATAQRKVAGMVEMSEGIKGDREAEDMELEV
ncbi:hypothetical protein BDN71DRAFT_1437078 [Pleurotus eryngii]|uniref:Uncharacterized protein n=1 Tax=Pleurotus eryngii TaxID=5323 RepID=A0A9P5ZGM8_PLEER|nr:hypothetical protein BDN71DRAFT_1437078 [Pleurotus eryngii]